MITSLRKLFGALKLRVNETKSKMARATFRTAKFLGFCFRKAKGGTVMRVAGEALART